MQASSSFVVEPVGLVVESLPRPLDWQQLYGNTNPVELEIGSGKGTFLVEQARARPDVNFFGIEWANWFYRYAADRLRRHGFTNAHMVRADANFFLREFVPDASLSVLHIYFPDPWPKARHQRRRTVQESFVPVVHRVLKPGGEIRVVTDHKGYWEENIEPTIKGSGLTIIDYARPGTAGEGETVGTNFERKYRVEGRPFYSIAARKDAAASRLADSPATAAESA
ncbi:MAG TPA: tRNA (guanosine(46)-N7)-methyltransferase TrmB [Tepidisphaeraceae bacterium]|jgi:tRNA (guanine-N7-)-methyltransferase